MMPTLFDAVSHCQKAVDGERDALEEHLLDYLTGIALHLKKLQPTRELFPFTFIDVEQQFLHLAREGGTYTGVGSNEHIIKILSFVQKEASMALSDFEKISRWIAIKFPQLESAVSSRVQQDVLNNVLERKTHMKRILGELPEYHWRRAEAIDRFATDEAHGNIPSTPTRPEGGRTQSLRGLKNVNYLRFCVLFDVEWYLKLRLMVEEIRSAHFLVCDAITKNVKQIMDPRTRHAGDGGRGQHMY